MKLLGSVIIDEYGRTAWIMAAEEGHFKVLMNLWGWAKDLNLKPEELKNELLSKSRLLKMSLLMASKP
jgi:hypothetical protein